MFTFRQGAGAEHKVTLHYGGGTPTVSVGKHEIALTFAPTDARGLT